MNDIRLSVSKTKVFLDCKAKYKFSYIDRLPKKTRDYHTTGKFCHKVLEDFHNEYINGSSSPYNETMTKAFKEAYKLYKPDMTKDMKKECWNFINEYLKVVSHNKEHNLSANVLACEKSFEVIIPGENNIILNGMIDRIQLDSDNVLHLADYKTTKNKKYLQNDWFQLLTYGYVMLNEDPKLEKIRASYILLRHNFEYITTEFTKEDLLKVKDKYVQYAEQILNEKEFKPTPTFMCNYCDFCNDCESGRKIINPINLYGEVEW